MTPSAIETGLQLRSLVRSSGELELSLAEIPVPQSGPDEVLVRVEATPINPSDLGLLFGAADTSMARQSGTAERPVVTASNPARADEGHGRPRGSAASRRQRRGGRGCRATGEKYLTSSKKAISR